MKSLIIPVLLSLLMGCQLKTFEIGKNCKSVSEVTTPSACYDKKAGLTLTALDVPSDTDLTWVIGPMQDTVGAGFYTPHNFKSASNNLVVPDSVIGQFPRIIIAFVAKNGCTSDIHFGFVRRTNKDSTCVTWHLTERYVKGD